jgi:hypothetical protein
MLLFIELADDAFALAEHVLVLTAEHDRPDIRSQ